MLKNVSAALGIIAAILAATTVLVSWVGDVYSETSAKKAHGELRSDHMVLRVKSEEDDKAMRRDLSEQIKNLRDDIKDGNKNTSAWLRQIYGKVE